MWENDYYGKKKTNLLEGEKNTIETCDALCSERPIGDTGSHRLKITRRERERKRKIERLQDIIT